MWAIEMSKPEWMIAVRRDTGQTVHNRIVVRVLGYLMRPNEKEQQTVIFEFAIPEDGAEKLVEGLQEVLSGPPPQGMSMPGMN